MFLSHSGFHSMLICFSFGRKKQSNSLSINSERYRFYQRAHHRAPYSTPLITCQSLLYASVLIYVLITWRHFSPCWISKSLNLLTKLKLFHDYMYMATFSPDWVIKISAQPGVKSQNGAIPLLLNDLKCCLSLLFDIWEILVAFKNRTDRNRAAYTLWTLVFQTGLRFQPVNRMKFSARVVSIACCV
jgi:hypothetical protein